jgi:DNA-binding Xre family transcriptional regulator
MGSYPFFQCIVVPRRCNVLTCHYKYVILDRGGLWLQELLREENVVTISCKFRLLLARVNVERVRQEKPALSLRRLAEESGVSLSVLAALNTDRSQRIDYTTIDQLLTYFSAYFAVTVDDLLTWEQPLVEEVV